MSHMCHLPLSHMKEMGTLHRDFVMRFTNQSRSAGLTVVLSEVAHVSGVARIIVMST